MDQNLVVLSGRLAAPTQVTTHPSGSRLIRVLVTTRSEHPLSRVDVIPVTRWLDSEDEAEIEALTNMDPGERIWTQASIQRRFWSGDDGRRSRIEVIAEQICRLPQEVLR